MDNPTKKNNSFLYIFIVILFLALGIILGVYGTKKYLSSKAEDDVVEEVDGVIDITDKKEYSETIKNLYALVSSNTIFYTSKGVSLETMDNNTKLSLMYTYALNNGLGTDDQFPWSFYGSSTCEYDFIVDPLEDTTSQTCSVVTIPVSSFVDNYKKLFNNTLLDTSVNFKPSEYKSCVLDGENYVCGNIGNVQGSLDVKFEIQKVTLEDDVLSIYDKGYLVDTRSNKIDSEDGYSNHYLHTADSNEYYYELKSADNVTFKHNFKKVENNYYYVSTEVVNKE